MVRSKINVLQEPWMLPKFESLSSSQLTSGSYGCLPLIMFYHTLCRPETNFCHFKELYNLCEAHEWQLLSVPNLFFVSLAKTFNDESNVLMLIIQVLSSEKN